LRISRRAGILQLMESFDLTNQFLIAMPALDDPNFTKTVTYVCVHNDEGAMGIVINRPLEITLEEVYEQMNLSNHLPGSPAQPVYQGGPVHTDRGFVLHRPGNAWDSTISVTPEIGVSTSRDILEAMAQGTGPSDCLLALGYAGWGAGQLEQEMADNAWLSGPASPEVIFQLAPEKRWSAAASALGIDVNALSHEVGHA
jgi:putative transcriptional regulator